MARKKKIKLHEAALLIITSRRIAELYIERYIEKRKSTREEAIEQLKLMGIEVSKLKD